MQSFLEHKVWNSQDFFLDIWLWFWPVTHGFLKVNSYNSTNLKQV